MHGGAAKKILFSIFNNYGILPSLPRTFRCVASLSCLKRSARNDTKPEA